jgi:hypothetical protein
MFLIANASTCQSPANAFRRAQVFKPIFQRLQEFCQEKGEKTKGDAKRRQAKMTDLTKKAQPQVKEATYLLR